MNNSHRLLILATLGVCGLMVASVTATAQPDSRVCARTMCTDMRSCSTYVPQPTPQLEKTDKPVGSRSNLVEKQKGGNDTQGEGPISTCRFEAYMSYLDCGNEQEGGVVKPNDNTVSGNTAKTVVTTPKK